MLCAWNVGKNKCQLIEDTYVCNGECLNVEKPCNGTCRPDTPVLCGDICLEKEKAKDFYTCDGNCQTLTKPCRRKCHDKFPTKCGKKCLAKNETCKLKTPKCEKNEFKCGEGCINKKWNWYWECDGECLKWTEPCNGTCHKKQPKKCGDQCVEDNNKHQEYEGHCYKSHVLCGGKCMEHLPHKCKGSCEGLSGDMIRHAETCDFPPKKIKYNTCVDICVSEETYKKEYKECDGECIRREKPCKGTCEKPTKLCHGECIEAEEECEGRIAFK
jgi:hypothetical protein